MHCGIFRIVSFFAATWIDNSDELGLIRLSDEPFVSDGSWYNIYVYEIM